MNEPEDVVGAEQAKSLIWSAPTKKHSVAKLTKPRFSAAQPKAKVGKFGSRLSQLEWANRKPLLSVLSVFLVSALVAVPIYILTARAASTDYQISFEQAQYTSAENGVAATIKIRLSRANDSGQPIKVLFKTYAKNDYNQTGGPDDSRRLGLAHGHDFGSGQDYNLGCDWNTDPMIATPESLPREITFPIGASEFTLPLEIANDTVKETNEVFQIQLFSPTNAVLGAIATTRYIIQDNDAGNVKNVITDFGASGNGSSDDTAAIQNAVNWLGSNGGGVLLFPPSKTYMVSSVDIKPNITYQGYGATIMQMPGTGNYTSAFTSRNSQYGITSDSAPLIIKGLKFDGNKANSPNYSYGAPDPNGGVYEHSHLLEFGNEQSPAGGRIKVFIEESSVYNSLADGISSVSNVDMRIFDVYGTANNRGWIDLNGGNNKTSIRKARSDNDYFHTEVDVVGYNNNYNGQHWVQDVYTQDYSMNYSYGTNNSSVYFENLTTTNNSEFQNLNTTTPIIFNHSKLSFGGSGDGYSGRLLWPAQMYFINSEMVINKLKPAPYAADIWMDLPNYPTGKSNQLLAFINTKFTKGSGFSAGDAVYGLSSASNGHMVGTGSNNKICVEASVTFDPSLTAPINYPTGYSSFPNATSCSSPATPPSPYATKACPSSSLMTASTSTSTPTPTPSATAVPAPASTGTAGNTIDDINPAFAYTGSWEYYPPGTESTLYQGGNHTSKVTNAAFTLTFNGGGVELYGTKDANYGKARVVIDGNNAGATDIDLYQATRAVQALIFQKTDLSAGNHTMVFTVLGTKNTSSTDVYTVIDKAVILAPTATAPSPTPTPTPVSTPTNPAPVPITTAQVGIVDDNHTSFGYTGSWEYYPPGTDDTQYQGGNRTSKVVGATASFKFSGGGIRLFGNKDSNYGKASVSVDGGAALVIDVFQPTRSAQSLMFEKTGLSSGVHTLVLTVLGAKRPASTDTYVVIDKAEVLAATTSSSGTPSPPPDPITQVTPIALDDTKPPFATKVIGQVAISPVSADDSLKVTKVEYYADGKKISTDTTAPYSLDTTLLSNGNKTITEKVTYSNGTTKEAKALIKVANPQNSLSPFVRFIRLNKRPLVLGGGGIGTLVAAGVGYFIIKRQHRMRLLKSFKGFQG